MINFSQNTNKRLIIHSCALQSIIFLLLTAALLIHISHGLIVRKIYYDGWFWFFTKIQICLYVFVVLTMIISKIPLINSFNSWKIKLLYLFTFGIFLLKVKDENIANFKLHRKTNLIMIFVWIFIFISFLLFFIIGSLVTNKAIFPGLWGIIFYESIIVLPPLIPLVFNLFLYKKSLSLAK